MRKTTREIRIGSVPIGAGNPVAVQSMTNTRTEDVEATVRQILELQDAGCDIVRCTVPTEEAAKAFSKIRERIRIPLVADIHFDWRLAVMAVENGADKIRINPGNIGSDGNLREVVRACRERDIPIRVGVNSGSLEKELLVKYGRVTAEGLVESSLSSVRRIEECGYDNIVVSIKSSDVLMSVSAYELLSERCDYPLHIGITEAGTVLSGSVKSGAGLGILLHEGIGDTIRVSLTGDPADEVRAARILLRSLGLLKGGIEIVSCPTCGRTKIDLIGLTREVEKMVRKYENKTLKIAVMGCVVNGPGEAREADIGIAGGDGCGVLIRRGEIVRKLPENELLSALEEEIRKA